MLVHRSNLARVLFLQTDYRVGQKVENQDFFFVVQEREHRLPSVEFRNVNSRIKRG